MYQSPLPVLDPETMARVYRFHGRDAGRLNELFDGKRTLAQVCDEGGISVTRGLALVERLTRRGELAVIEPATEKPSGFSTLDEAFFSSEVPIDEWECEEPAEPATTRMRKALTRLRDRLVPRLAAAGTVH